MAQPKHENEAEDLFAASCFCALTGELMNDPVIDHEGNTYERSAIQSWLRRNSTSPITRSPLEQHQLVPNRALRESIQDRKQELKDQGKDFPRSKADFVAPVSLESTVELAAGISSSDGVSISAVTHQVDEASQNVTVTVTPPEGQKRTPVHLACVVDISGSMNEEATVTGAAGTKESHGLSLLDVVKHAVRTIIAALGPDDQLSLVSYSDSGRVDCSLRQMNKAGKNQVLKVLEGLHTEGCTNLWDGKPILQI